MNIIKLKFTNFDYWGAERTGNFHTPFNEGQLEKYFSKATRWLPTLLPARFEDRGKDEVIIYLMPESYLLLYFRKESAKQPRAEWVDFGGRRIFDVIV